jgi:hypothetical protein
MLKNVFFVVFLLFWFSAFCVAEVTLLFPENVSLKSGDSVLVGFVSPGQTFDLVFSDNSGFDFEWDSASVDRAVLPQNWEFVSSQATDTSVSVTLKVPVNAAEDVYVIPVKLSSSVKPDYEVVNVKVGVKQNLVSVSFARVSSGKQYKLGELVEYSVQVVNSSIANDSVLVEANLPSNWFSAKKIVVKARSSGSASIFVAPQAYGKRVFYLSGSVVSSGVVVQSFSSEIEVAPTLRGKFSAPLSGFPFFTFGLAPFQLFDSLLSVFMK